jgi:hypothetical protein
MKLLNSIFQHFKNHIMQTLEITKEAALKAHNDASSKGKVLLENLFGKETFLKDVKDRINSIDDAIKELGDNDPDVIEYRELVKNGAADHIIAYSELIIIVKAYNGYEEPNYNNSSQFKCYPIFKLSSSGVGFSYSDYDFWYTYSSVGSRLDFLNYDNMKDAVNKFLPVYKRWALK